MKSLVLIILLSILGCKKGPKLLTEMELLEMTRNVDPQSEILLPSEENPKVNCDFYGPGCEYGLTIRFKNLVVIVVKFSSIESAQDCAFQFDAYTKANWVFDYVQGEPILEEIFTKKLQAIKIHRPGIKRKPYKPLNSK